MNICIYIISTNALFIIFYYNADSEEDGTDGFFVALFERI